MLPERLDRHHGNAPPSIHRTPPFAAPEHDRPLVRMIYPLAFSTVCLAVLSCTLLPGDAWTGQGGETTQALETELAGILTWRGTDRHFGGFSGIEILENGRGALLVSDRGTLRRVVLRRRNGALTAVRNNGMAILAPGITDRMDKTHRDAEGIAILPDGRVAVSFEGRHRVAVYPPPPNEPTGPTPRLEPQRVLIHQGWPGMRDNAGLESLAADSSGNLFAVPEISGGTDRKIPVFVWTGNAWQVAAQLPSSLRFSPVGADFGPDGRFYLLERKLTLLGFRSRLRSFLLTPDGAGDERQHILTQAGWHANLEGLSVWRDQQGRLRATIISDDNFSPLQLTEILEYILANPPHDPLETENPSD